MATIFRLLTVGFTYKHEACRWEPNANLFDVSLYQIHLAVDIPSGVVAEVKCYTAHRFDL